MFHCLPVRGSVRVENEVRVAGFPGSQTINITNTSEAITTRQRHFDPCLILQSSVSKIKSHIVFLVT
jgi:hypothetical protein